MKRKLLSLAVASALCLSLLPASAMAATASVNVTLENGAFTQYGPCAEGLIGAYRENSWTDRGWTYIDVNGKTVIDKTGREVIPQQYTYRGRMTVDDDPGSLFWVEDPSRTESGHDRILLINAAGQTVAGPYYQPG